MSVRRSSRRRGEQTPSFNINEALANGRDQDGFVVKYINSYIGYGVFAEKKFLPGEFLLEYRGELVGHKEGKRRELELPLEKGSFLFFFSFDGKRLCIDSSDDPHQLCAARMVNDDHRAPNTVMKVVSILGYPHLCVFATRNILPGDELRYDYGVVNLPWRKNLKRKACSPERETSLDDLTFCGLKKRDYPLGQMEKKNSEEEMFYKDGEDGDGVREGGDRDVEDEDGDVGDENDDGDEDGDDGDEDGDGGDEDGDGGDEDGDGGDGDGDGGDEDGDDGDEDGDGGDEDGDGGDGDGDGGDGDGVDEDVEGGDEGNEARDDDQGELHVTSHGKGLELTSDMELKKFLTQASSANVMFSNAPGCSQAIMNEDAAIALDETDVYVLEEMLSESGTTHVAEKNSDVTVGVSWDEVLTVLPVLPAVSDGFKSTNTADHKNESSDEDDEEEEECVRISDVKGSEVGSVENPAYRKLMERESSGAKVPPVKHNVGRRVYDKVQACYFCAKLFPKIARHMQDAHKEEVQVGKALAATGAEKRRHLKELRLKGNFEHNITVIAEGKGELIVVRRGKTRLPAAAYLPCKYCLGFYSKKELWKHVGNCDIKSSDTDETDGDAIKSGKWILLGSVCPRFEKEDLVKWVLSTLRDDDISAVVKKDSFLLQMGNSKLQKLGIKKAHVVREQLRLGARILIELRNITNRPKGEFADFLNPGSFDHLVQAVKNICIQAEQRSLTGIIQLEKPALALKMGQVLKKIICLKEGWAIRHRLPEAKGEAEDVLKLFHREWNDKVNSSAFQTLRERRYNNNELLPLTEDLQRLKHYQISEMKMLTCKLKMSPSRDTWRKLALTTLGRISVFNKRREAEVGEVPLSLYLKSKTSTVVNTDLLEGLTEFEKDLCTRLHHLEVIGKQNRKVPIVLTKDMVEAVDVLINFRTSAKTREDNPYVFAGSGLSHLHTAEAIKLAAREAGLKSPELVTSTKLRKYMATVSQVVNLTENELEYLANHMGHNISVHRNFYRLQDSTIELAKVSRLLLAAEEGKLGSFSGKALNDIHFSDFPDYTEELLIDEAEAPELPHDLRPSGEKETGDVAQAPNISKTVDEHFDGDIGALVAHTVEKEKRGKNVRTTWSNMEMKALANLVEESVASQKPPKKAVVLSCMANHPSLSTREWTSIKYRVWGEAQKIMKTRAAVKKSLLS